MALRLQAMGQANCQQGFKVALQGRMLELPLRWKKPPMEFVKSMSDLFHNDVPDEYIQRVFTVMRQASWHTFQVLTKRADRLATIGQTRDWPDNVWMGVSGETPTYLPRIDRLRRVPARVRFVSFEPLLASLGIINLAGIDWAIVGGESGPGARSMEKTWVIEKRNAN